MALLNRLNGWQRLCLVIAACFVTYGAIVKPLTVCSAGRLSSFDYRRSLERDLQNPDLVRRRKAGRDTPTQLNTRECSPADSTCAAARIARLRHAPLGSSNIPVSEGLFLVSRF
jgi:hypothetical protein